MGRCISIALWKLLINLDRFPCRAILFQRECFQIRVRMALFLLRKLVQPLTCRIQISVLQENRENIICIRFCLFPRILIISGLHIVVICSCGVVFLIRLLAQMIIALLLFRGNIF